jgi:hypothetical protein
MNFTSRYTLSKTQKQALLIDVLVSALAQILPLVNVVSQIYSTLFHEFGHAITAWLFGYIALPRLDFINGGGVTHLLGRPLFLCAIAIVFVILNILLLKKNSKTGSNKLYLLLLAGYLIVFFTPLNRLLITFMGKGGELLFFYFVGWYALSQLVVRMDVKAIIYLILAVFLWVNSVIDSFKLLFDDSIRLWYEGGKQDLLGGTTLVNDLVKLTNSTGLSFGFFNWLLLIVAFYSLHKLLKITDRSLLDKHRIREYGVSLIQITQQQVKKLKTLGHKPKK